jgi:hypothetical protein
MGGDSEMDDKDVDTNSESVPASPSAVAAMRRKVSAAVKGSGPRIRGPNRVRKRSEFGDIKPLVTEDEVAMVRPRYWSMRLPSFVNADLDAKPIPEGSKRPGNPVKRSIRLNDEEIKKVNEGRVRDGGRIIQPWKPRKRREAQ